MVDDLNCYVTILSEALGQCSGGEDILKMLLGSGRREDPFKLDDDQESWDDCPEGSSPEARGMTSPYPKHELKGITSCSECDQEKGGDVDIRMEEEKEERGAELSLSDDTPLAMRIVKSSSGGSHIPIPGFRGESEGLSYVGC